VRATIDGPSKKGMTPSETRADFTPEAPVGQRLYAIGDIHGCRGHLTRLLDAIATDLQGAPKAEAIQIIFVGDYIDRGPDSAGVIDDILALTQEGLPDGQPVDVVALKGNHEDYFDAMLRGDLTRAAHWMMNGGEETLESYGVTPPERDDDPKDMARAARDLAVAVPPVHKDFLAGLRLIHRAGDYLFVHAGLRPGVPIEDQREEELIWIRKPFLESDADFGALVVHGHTVVARVEEKPNRLDIDTGACYGGDLTAVCFWGTERHFLQVSF